MSKQTTHTYTCNKCGKQVSTDKRINACGGMMHIVGAWGTILPMREYVNMDGSLIHYCWDCDGK